LGFLVRNFCAGVITTTGNFGCEKGGAEKSIIEQKSELVSSQNCIHRRNVKAIGDERYNRLTTM
jgi:hypothetical protein